MFATPLLADYLVFEGPLPLAAGAIAALAGACAWALQLVQRALRPAAPAAARTPSGGEPYVSANDAAARALAEMQQRAAAEDNYRSIFENAVEGIFRTSPDGRYLAANPSLARIYGYESVDAMMGGIKDIANELYVDPTRRDAFRQLLSAGDVITDFEAEVRRCDGRCIWISENARAHRSAAGDLLYYEGTVVDVTVRKRAARLRREKDAAEEASRAKSQFLATMSHEIRTPLNGILGMLEMLSQTDLDERQRHYADIARTSADALMSQINDVLDFSKIEAGRLELESIDFDLTALVEAAPAILGHRAEKKGLVLSCDVAPGLPRRFAGDRDRLRQVLMNLVGNALKFTQQGGVSIRVTAADGYNAPSPSVAGEAPEPLRVRFEVQDTGVGIPANCLGKMFCAYSQAEASTTRHYGGTGLGLAICKQLVELMGGEIGVESTPAAGTTFWFVVPLQLAAAEVEVRSTSGASPRTERLLASRELAPTKLADDADASSRRAARILVVDDNEINQMVAVEMLQSAGWQADTANNGREAVDACRTGRYDVVLMDCQMPGMDGYAATRLLRTEELAGASFTPQGGPLPIIALTAEAVVGDRQRCLDAGMSDYVVKPINPIELLAALGRALQLETPLAWPTAPRRSLVAAPVAPPAAEPIEVAGAEPLDVSQLTERFRGDREFVDSLLETFVASARERVDQLAASVGRNSAADVHALAHSLKGAAGNVSATRLSQAAAALEAAASAQRGGEFRRLQLRIERELTCCEEAINALLAAAPGS